MLVAYVSRCIALPWAFLSREHWMRFITCRTQQQDPDAGDLVPLDSAKSATEFSYEERKEQWLPMSSQSYSMKKKNEKDNVRRSGPAVMNSSRVMTLCDLSKLLHSPHT